MKTLDKYVWLCQSARQKTAIFCRVGLGLETKMKCKRCEANMHLASYTVIIRPTMPDAVIRRVLVCPKCKYAVMELPQVTSIKYIIYLFVRVDGKYRQARIIQVA